MSGVLFGLLASLNMHFGIGLLEVPLLSSANASGSGSVVWRGRPWIVPAAIAHSLVAISVAIIFVWIEYATGTAGFVFLGLNVAVWTVLAIFVIWLVSLTDLFVERATNAYVLRNDGLEIRTGILTSRSFVVVASGFSDLEVVRGVVGRIIEYGDIIIHTQSETMGQKIMIKVRDPLHVADQIRYVMGRPMVRVEQSLPSEKK